jgi:hypothetical protein
VTLLNTARNSMLKGLPVISALAGHGADLLKLSVRTEEDIIPDIGDAEGWWWDLPFFREG